MAKFSFLEQIKRGLNSKDDPCISKIERVRAIFVDRGTTKSPYLKIFKSQYFYEFFRYWSDFLHVIINPIVFKICGDSHHSFFNPEAAQNGPPPHLAENLKSELDRVK